MPPYTTETARKHNKAARKSPKAQRAFAHAAENASARGLPESEIMREGNFAADQSLRKSARSKKRK